MIALARSLSLAVTAEGGETLTQLRELRDLACDEGQGYLFARPQPSVGAALLNAMHDSDDDDVTRSRAA